MARVSLPSGPLPALQQVHVPAVSGGLSGPPHLSPASQGELSFLVRCPVSSEPLFGVFLISWGYWLLQAGG